MNKVILMGRLTRDAEVRYSQGDNSMAIARFTIAVDRRQSRNNANGENTADFIGCVAFGKTAEFLERFGRKGTKFAVEGRIQTGSYTNRDGQKVFTTDVVVEQIEFAESKSSASGAAGNYNAGSYNAGGYRPAPSNNAGGYTQPEKPAPSAASNDGFMNIPDSLDEELPFN